MPDELVTGGTVAENPDATGTATASENVGGQDTTSTEFESRFGKGKTLAEVQKMVLEQDKQIGKVGERLGKVDELQAEVNLLREYVQSRQEPRYAPPQPPEPQKPELEYDPLNPDRYFEAKLADRETKMRREFQAYLAQNMVRDAQANFYKGREMAYANKELFGGIERDVESAIQKAAANMHPSELADPRVWEKVGRFIRMERGEWDKVVPKKQGMAPATNERPGGNRRVVDDDDEETLSPEMVKMARDSGLTEEEALKAYKDAKRRDRRYRDGWRG